MTSNPADDRCRRKIQRGRGKKLERSSMVRLQWPKIPLLRSLELADRILLRLHLLRLRVCLFEDRRLKTVLTTADLSLLPRI